MSGNEAPLGGQLPTPDMGQSMISGGADIGPMPSASVEAYLRPVDHNGYGAFGTPGYDEALQRAKEVAADRVATKYDHLLDPNTPDEAFSVEKAAVRKTDTSTGSTSVPTQTSDREGYWKPATQAQIEEAAQHGFDLKAANDKYHPGWNEEDKN